jgi:lipopolysaccharide/colanic/teichoic acid biosynthesis glycosyltransferase
LMGALLVRWWGGVGPVLFRQERLGRFGRKFEVLKLRTMGVDAEASGAQWSTENDPRVTPVGRFLRKFRIDEIPQLWNVLRGDMSFVGPRPEREEFGEQLTAEIPYFSERLLIHPGITGWAQVCYPYGATVEDARRKLEFDLYYLKNMGLVMDLFVLLDTIKIVLVGGASRRRGDKLAEFEKKLEDARQQVRLARRPALLDVS